VDSKRRQLLASISAIGAGAILIGCSTPGDLSSATNKEKKGKEAVEDEAAGVEVTAPEDLMREHGILRRVLLVYSEAAAKLRQDPKSVRPDDLEKAAQLFRVFGEDYHEKKLEEGYLFPVLKKGQGVAAVYVDVLVAQHARGREITDYILGVTKGDEIPPNSVTDFANNLDAFVRMYEHHAAIEDTVIIPAWKAAIGDKQLDELGAKFEEIEAESFGGDGFETASKRVSEIEEAMGMANLGMFTAPPPPGKIS